MARLQRSPREFLFLWFAMKRRSIRRVIVMILIMLTYILRRRVRRMLREPSTYNPIHRLAHLDRMIVRSDIACIEQLRMDRHTFNILCSLVREIGGLRDTKNMVVEEMMAMFLHILAFEEKNREIKYDFQRSGETISRHFHDVLRAVLKLSRVLLKKPEPIPEDSTDERWKWFKNCIGALDGTLIDVTVPVDDKSRYRSRKNTISTNVLGACAPDLQFIYVLAGWEGSAADGRVLRSALERDNRLKVPRGNYYLADLGYKHCEGFLVPYRNIRYHEWRRGNEQPNSKEELYNMKHASARNVIERAFGLLKMRWGALSKEEKMGEDARGRGKNKRMWTSIEESALVDILVDMQHSNWKCDTGYKTGYQSHIEKKMLERFPYCGLKGKPHIESKIKILKRQLGYILEAQKQASGFGWDDEMKMITGEKEVFMGWAQGRDGASALYMKPFPLYEKLCEIYAKDRASGSMSKGPGDEEGDNNNEGDKQGDGSTSSTTQATEPSSSRGDRKRRREIENEELGGLSKALVSLIDVEKESTAVMNDLKKSFMRDVEIGEKRTKLFQALSGLEELSPMEIVEASTSIGLDDKKVELFFSMPDDFKVMFVKSQLKK